MTRRTKTLTKYIDKVGEEDEGFCTEDQSESRMFHYDSSVEVSGNDRDDGGCDCDNGCDCTDCMACDDCGDPVDECGCDGCIVCNDCDCDMDDCKCYNKRLTEGCSDCSMNLGDACSGCREDNFRDNSRPNCMDMGNYHSNCQYDCGCEIEHECGGSDRDGSDGEMVSPPLDVADLPDWTRANYPQETNSTCGSHQHTSFKRMKYYSIVMCRGFQEYMTRELFAWAKATGIREGSSFYRRMRGDVHWCKREYDAFEQINSTSKEDCRYRVINYCWSLMSHSSGEQMRTMEVRVLPAFQDVEYTISAHKELNRIIEQYVETNIDSLEHRRKQMTCLDV
jgi:hypothetical protein